MVVYRIDLLDEEGRISTSGSVVYPDDREALRAAAEAIGQHRAVEIWDQTRVVGQLTAVDCARLKQRTARPSPDPRRAGDARTEMTG
jgi:hypothetical protein